MKFLLFLTPSVPKTHLESIHRKLDDLSRVEVVLRAPAAGLVDL